ncbi:uncharacterized protein METZ01_LOCUS432964 [marine metagenome]|uniref:Uncharacterized protein n=1 Tax=marine metagenome TaxID=408172 RepID=A0A382YAI2_9ZZZZ
MGLESVPWWFWVYMYPSMLIGKYFGINLNPMVLWGCFLVLVFLIVCSGIWFFFIRKPHKE